MLRYIAYAWDIQTDGESAIARLIGERIRRSDETWSEAFAAPGLVVFHSNGTLFSSEATPLSGAAGVIIGDLFERRPEPSTQNGYLRPRFDETATSRVVSSKGRLLTQAYWGSYVAFVADAHRDEKWLLVAPTGSLACFTARLKGVHIFFSRTEDIVKLNLFSFTVNWDCFVAHVVFRSVRGTETGIKEITEVKAGECVTLKGGRQSRELYWNPFTIAKEGITENPREIAKLVRAIADDVVRAWASRHRRIVHQLSGGLDSSEVLLSLRDAAPRPQITCMNQYSISSNGDERAYARMVADKVPCDLVEMERPVNLRLDEMLHGSRTANPFPHFMQLVAAVPAVELAQRTGATAIFTGSFGDSLFHTHPAPPAAADYAMKHGFGPSLARVAFDLALLERTSIWRVLKYALRERFSRGPRTYWSVHHELDTMSPPNQLINMELGTELARDNRFVHPWFHSLDNVPPGKLWQVFIFAVGSADDPLARPTDASFVHPLVSQPLAELCLRIPVYVHLHGGWDRAMARMAFADDLPPQIATRTSKGGLEEFAKGVLMNNIGFVREMLLDGALAREGLIRKRPLEEALSGKPTKIAIHPGDIFACLSNEVWLRSWTRTEVRAVT